jgi:hypothetical protein
MNALRSAATELFGLFVEDRTFALATVAWLAASGFLAYLHVPSPEVRGIVLFVGLAVILIAGVFRAAVE